MRSVTDQPGRGGSTPARRELNEHMSRKHHGEPALTGTTFQRLVAHEELHNARNWDHTHDDYELPAQWSVSVKDA